MLVANTRFQARFDTKTRRGSSPPLIDHLNGKLDYLRMVRGADDPLYTRYAISANKLSFNRPYGVAVWGRAAKQERLLAEAVWMLLGSNSQGVQVTQGTAFSLARVGVITAAHVLNDSSVTSWAIVKASDPTIEIPITEGRIHNHLDIAILTCLCNQSASLRIRPETVTQGEAATIVGFPDWIARVIASSSAIHMSCSLKSFLVCRTCLQVRPSGAASAADPFLMKLA
jgi:hypothetical protein